MELKIVDPRSLRENPDKQRRTQSTPQADALLQASIAAVGVVQPPVVTPDPRNDGNGFVINAGHRRVTAAMAAGLDEIMVLVTENADGQDAMRALAENIAREPLNPVDQWRAVERLVALEWTEESIAIALALPVRQVRKLRLLANILPAMLDQMARGDMPAEPQLRAIAAASQEEQAQVWKKHKPKKAEPRVIWSEVARALSKRRIEAKCAKFGDDLAQAYGIDWHEDLFAPADENGRYTTDVDAFFGAQQEWLANNLPARGILLEVDHYGQPKLPPKAERIWGKPGKGDHTGWYIDQRTGNVGSIAYRLPQPKKADPKSASGADDGEVTPVRTRPDVTRKGVEMIGDLRTDALHEALHKAPIADDVLLAMLVLGYAGNNVTVATGSSDNPYGRSRCNEIAASLVVPSGIVADRDALLRAAREMLVEVLSCREGRSSSGLVSRVAGAAIGADEYLPNMATEGFLSCLSRRALEGSLRDTPVQPRNKVKDTRKALVEHFVAGRFVHPAALFKPAVAELKAYRTRTDAWSATRHDEAEGLDPEDGDASEAEYLDAAE